MPKTITEGFKKLRENLEITDLQESTVSTRQTNVREVIEGSLTVVDSFLTGSYRRSTMIAPLKEADVDIFTVLSSSYFEQNGQAAVLDRVRAALKKRYSTPQISRNGQAVTIYFEDFRVDVVPAFHRRGGGFLIPDPPRHRWISTDPRAHVSISTDQNKAHGGYLVPVIKMLKAWNRNRGSLLHSFHLEVIALAVFNGVAIPDYPPAVRFFFDKAFGLVRTPLRDPAGYDSDVGAYLSAADALRVMGHLAADKKKAVAAENLAAAGLVREAYDQWRAIFGDAFPAYG
jgi:hypothetical protein